MQIIGSTATFTNGSATVTDSNATFQTDGAAAGDFITVVDSGVSYEISVVDSETQLTLTANYAGTTTSADAFYVVYTDFTSPSNIPYINKGDIETASILKRAINRIQELFTGIISGGTTLTNVDINSGTIDNTTIAGGTIDNTTIGGTTPAAVTTNSLTATGGTITGITDLAVADGGTGASTASAARTNLDVPENAEVIGVHTANFSTAADITLSASEAVNYTIKITGTEAGDLIVPLDEGRYYIIDNQSSLDRTMKVSGQTGVSVPAGTRLELRCGASDVEEAATYAVLGGLDVSGFMTNGYLPYSNAGVMADSPLSTDGTKVGLGTDSPSDEFHVAAAGPRIRIQDTGGAGDAAFPNLVYSDSADAILGTIGYLSAGNSDFYIENRRNGAIIFETNDVEILKLGADGDLQTNNDLLVGTTSTTGLYNGSSTNPGINLDGVNKAVIVQRNNQSCFFASKASGYTNNNFHTFYVAGSVVGSITTNGTNTAYNTSSDYRLKANYLPISDGIERLMGIPVYRGEFIATPGVQVDYFIAHELAQHIPEAVSGEKDEARAATNCVLSADGRLLAEGVTKLAWEYGQAEGKYPADSTWADECIDPVYQGVDQSKVVPLLTAALQEEVTAREVLIELLVSKGVLTDEEARTI